MRLPLLLSAFALVFALPCNNAESPKAEMKHAISIAVYYEWSYFDVLSY